MSLLDTLAQAIGTGTPTAASDTGATAPADTGDDLDRIAAMVKGQSAGQAPAPQDTGGPRPIRLAEPPDDLDIIAKSVEDQPGKYSADVLKTFGVTEPPTLAAAAGLKAPAQDQSVTPATAPADKGHQLTGAAKFGSDVFEAGAGLVDNPVNAAMVLSLGVPGVAELLATPAAWTGGKKIGQVIASQVEPDVYQEWLKNGGSEVSDLDAGTAAAQLAAFALPIGRLTRKALQAAKLPEAIGSRATGILEHTIPGAAIGGALDPSHPAVGATVGGVLGAVHGVASGERTPVGNPTRIVEPETEAHMASDQPLALESGAPFTVETNSVGDALDEIANQVKNGGGAAPPAAPSATPPATPSEAAAAPTAAPAEPPAASSPLETLRQAVTGEQPATESATQPATPAAAESGPIPAITEALNAAKAARQPAASIADALAQARATQPTAEQIAPPSGPVATIASALEQARASQQQPSPARAVIDAAPTGTGVEIEGVRYEKTPAGQWEHESLPGATLEPNQIAHLLQAGDATLSAPRGPEPANATPSGPMTAITEALNAAREEQRQAKLRAQQHVPTSIADALATARAAAGGPQPHAPTAPAATETGPLATIRNAVESVRAGKATAAQIQEQGRRDELRRAAETDPLTGVGNRAALDRALPVAEADPHMAVMTFDVDHGGIVNKANGQKAGDAMIRREFEALQEAARQVGVPVRVFRRGGDEGVVLVPHARAEEVRQIAQDTFGTLPVEHQGQHYTISLTGTHGNTFDEADARLQDEKRIRKAALAPPKRNTQARDEPIGNIDVAPEELQYKLNTNEHGETGALADARYDPDLAGIITVARDPVTGRLKVVNGHQRYGLALRTNAADVAAGRAPSVTHMLVREIPWTDAAKLRAHGAIINIAEGNGTAVDAAKLFRDEHMTAADLTKRGIALSGPIARDGLALAKLPASLFADVVAGKIPIQRAAVIGASGLTDEQMSELYRMLEQREAAGKRMTNEAVTELVRFVKGAGSETTTQESLFGTEQMTKSLAPEKAELSAHVKDRLAKDRRLFGFLTKGDRATRIEGAGAGKIETAKATDLATRAAQTEEVYNKLSTMSGPISDALNQAARELAQGGDKRAIQSRLYEAVTGALTDVHPGAGASEPRGAAGSDRGGAAPGHSGHGSEAAVRASGPVEESGEAPASVAQRPGTDVGPAHEVIWNNPYRGMLERLTDSELANVHAEIQQRYAGAREGTTQHELLHRDLLDTRNEVLHRQRQQGASLEEAPPFVDPHQNGFALGEPKPPAYGPANPPTEQELKRTALKLKQAETKFFEYTSAHPVGALEAIGTPEGQKLFTKVIAARQAHDEMRGIKFKEGDRQAPIGARPVWEGRGTVQERGPRYQGGETPRRQAIDAVRYGFEAWRAMNDPSVRVDMSGHELGQTFEHAVETGVRAINRTRVDKAGTGARITRFPMQPDALRYALMGDADALADFYRALPDTAGNFGRELRRYFSRGMGVPMLQLAVGKLTGSRDHIEFGSFRRNLPTELAASDLRAIGELPVHAATDANEQAALTHARTTIRRAIDLIAHDEEATRRAAETGDMRPLGGEPEPGGIVPVDTRVREPVTSYALAKAVREELRAFEQMEKELRGVGLTANALHNAMRELFYAHDTTHALDIVQRATKAELLPENAQTGIARAWTEMMRATTARQGAQRRFQEAEAGGGNAEPEEKPDGFTPRTPDQVQTDLFGPQADPEKFRSTDPISTEPALQRDMAERVAALESDIQKYQAMPLPGSAYKTTAHALSVRVAQRMVRDADAAVLQGATVETVADLAAALQITRNPFYETFRVGLHKGSQIVGQSAVSSRMAGTSSAFIPGSTNDDLARYIVDRAQLTGADGWHMAHNHPNAVVDASEDDKRLTGDVVRLVNEETDRRGLPRLKFHGHIIVNHLKYAVLQPGEYGGAVETRHELPGAGKARDPFRRDNPELPIGMTIVAEDDLAKAVQLLAPSPGNATIIWTGGQYGAITEVGTLSMPWLAKRVAGRKAIDEVAQRFFEHANTMNGALRAFLLAEDTHIARRVIKELMVRGIVLHGGFASTDEHGTTHFEPAPDSWINADAAVNRSRFGAGYGSELAADRAVLSRVSEPQPGYLAGENSRAALSSPRTAGSDEETRATVSDEGSPLRPQRGDDGRAAERGVVERGGRLHPSDPDAQSGRGTPAGIPDGLAAYDRWRRGELGGPGSERGNPSLRDARRVGERDLFGNDDESDLTQGSLFSSKQGSEASRSLAETERAARSELERLRAREKLSTSPLERAKIARRAAELEKLLNRNTSISADELRTRARGESDDLFGGGVREPKSSYGAGGAPVPMPEPSGITQAKRSFRPIEAFRKIKALLNPESLGPEARATGGQVRASDAQSFRDLRQATEALRSLRDLLDKQPRARQVELWDKYERGLATGDATIDRMNGLLHAVTQKRTDQLIANDRLQAERAIINYLGRFWSDPKGTGKVQDFLRSVFGKRPAEGRKSFLKERDIERFVDGLRKGLTPATYNYVESQLAKIAEMERLIAFDRTLAAEKAAGRAKPIMLGKEPPVDVDGNPWTKIDRTENDPAFTIYGPPVISHWEAVDTVVYGKLAHLLERLGVTHTRAAAIGGQRLGYAEGDRRITTKFGGAEGVIMHELGHILDARYGLKNEIIAGIGAAPRRTVQTGKRAGQSVPDYSKQGGDTQEARTRRTDLNEELRQLANLRRERVVDGQGVAPTSSELDASDRAYLHSWPEKMANIVEAYIAARPRFRQVAPGIFDMLEGIIAQHPELHALRDIQPSLSREAHTTETRLPGPVIVGHWYAPRNSDAIWQAHLSRGLKGNPIYDALTAPGRAATQVLLGFSGFHGTTIATEGMFSDMVMAMDHAASGEPIKATAAVARAATAPASGVVFGRRVMQEYVNPGSHPELARVIEAMVQGGFRGQATSELWSGDRKEALKRAVRQALHGDGALRKAFGASKVPLDAIYAGIEAASAPLMSKYVPLMKTAATYRAVAKRLAELPTSANVETVQREMSDIVKEMDYRFGQVQYDNHFINRFAKDLAQAMFLAPGWTFGTLSLMERGVAGVATIPKRIYDRATGKDQTKQPFVGRSAKYWIAAVVGTMLLNGLLTYLYTGERPASDNEDGDAWKDFFAFRDGTYDVDGNANRHTIPGYLMHDVYGWTHHGLDTFLNKLSPFFAFSSRVIRNRTYFGDMIRDPDAPPLTQAKQIGTEAAKEFTPLSVQNYLEGRNREESKLGESLRDVFGVTPAKREFERSDAQNMIAEFQRRHGHDVATPDETEARDDRQKVLLNMRGGASDDIADAINRAVEHGGLTPPQLTVLMKRAGILPLMERYKALTLDEALSVFDAATPREKGLFIDILNQKIARASRAR